MTVREKLGRAQAVLVLGSDDGNRSVYPDPAWLMAGETGAEAFEQVSKHRKSYTAGIILTATELRELADTLDHDTPETVKSALLDTAASYRGLLCEVGYQELTSECNIVEAPHTGPHGLGKNRQMNRAFRCAGSTTEEGVIATTAWGESGFPRLTT
jgi:hypothetical protein